MYVCLNARASSADLTDVVEHVGLAQEPMSATSKQVSAGHVSQTAKARSAGTMDVVANARQDALAINLSAVRKASVSLLASFPSNGDLLVCSRSSKPLLTKLMSRQTA